MDGQGASSRYVEATIKLELYDHCVTVAAFAVTRATNSKGEDVRVIKALRFCA